jgi:small GTP-binding protein
MAAGKLKIVVFGAFNAGKSSFIQAIDPTSRHVEAPADEGTTTVAMDFGRVTVRNMQVFLFGTPGQERFEFVRQIISRGMDAAIMIIDCTCEMDEFTRALYQRLSEEGIPLAVMLNKCDMVESCPAMIRRQLGDVAMFDISTIDKNSARKALDAFVGTLVADL